QDGLDSYQFDSSIGPDNRQLGFGLSGTGAGDWKASASGSYSTEDVKTELEGWLRSDGGVGGSAKIDWTSGEWSAGGETSFEIGNDRVLDVGLYAGFRSRDEFRTWMGRYAYASEHDRHTFSLLAEEKLGNIYTRLEHSTVMGATGEQYNTSLHGAYFLDNSQKTAIIGGLRHRRDFDGSHNYTPEVGMQLDRNALTLGYDIEQEAVMLNFVMPFGRK
ncbi:MAG: hypothetical protein KTR31_19120, partial [Myxococcales bacterium]|nr:hypothetical protein [Myxococcales bacterium]